MALARGPVRRGSGTRRTALFLIFTLGCIVLVSLVNRGTPLHAGSGRLLIEDKSMSDTLYQLAKASSDAASFAARLQQAGLMLDSSSSSGSSKEGKADGGAGAVQPSKGAGGGQAVVPLLSRDLARKHQRDGIIIVTWANFHFFDFVLNWVHHMEQHGISNYLVGAMDAETGQALAAKGLNVFAMYDEGAGQADTGLGTADFGWGSPTFHKMGRQKVDLARTFTGYGLDLCLCDVDTVWINDPTEYFERWPAADILASSDALTPTNPEGDEGLEQLEAIHSAMNIGLLFFRHGPNTTSFIDAWQRTLDADSKAWDQNVFNHVAHEGMVPFQPVETEPRLTWGANHSLVFGVLPVAQFASGHTFFVQRLFELQKVKPYVVHTTFQYGGSKGKRHRLREAMLWVDPPEYYSEGLFLSIDMEYPSTPKGFQLQDQVMMEGIRFKTEWETNDMVDVHLAAMERQLHQLRTAFQLAVALNRTIIMPKLLSWCDRYWGPVEFCQVPGAFKSRLPFVAPMDHVLEPFHFDDTPDGVCPPISYREYSFLANERTPKSLEKGKVVVTPDAGVTKVQEKKEDGHKVVRIPTNPSDAQLRELLAPYKDVQLLHFSSLDKAFGKWESEADGDKFQNRLSRMAGFFCCKQVKAGEDGGVGYGQYLADPSKPS
ncbi:hypothetical protein D9Q98_005475 [Chlorella vulgaris]|uniref:Nucleotide-diphospho-sugar transferase domain-containing protein n=1 Tax=Chlorella vulgaris TaxID=3077 RepID=A0A9D4TM77_CHLVU|nr:hypothetical protein D9Q98_005475 [Chlorella vulgaris]